MRETILLGNERRRKPVEGTATGGLLRSLPCVNMAALVVERSN